MYIYTYVYVHISTSTFIHIINIYFVNNIKYNIIDYIECISFIFLFSCCRLVRKFSQYILRAS